MTNSISENRISQGTQIWLSNWSYLSKIKSRVLCFSLLFTTGFFLSGADRRGKKMEGLLCFCFAAFIILGWSFASLAWRSAKLMSDNFDSFTQRHNRRLLKTTGELSITLFFPLQHSPWRGEWNLAKDTTSDSDPSHHTLILQTTFIEELLNLAVISPKQVDLKKVRWSHERPKSAPP